jgi:hypothetical protein
VACLDYLDFSAFDFATLTAEGYGAMVAECPGETWIVSEYQNVIPRSAEVKNVIPRAAATKNVIPLGSTFGGLIA